MDKMIDQIAEMLKPNTMNPKQIDAVGVYLVGKSSLESTVAALPAFGKRGYRNYLYSSYFNYIAAECHRDPKLSERLGRYLRLLSKLDEETYFHACDRCRETFGEKELFMTTGLGATALMEYMCNKNNLAGQSEELLRELYDGYQDEMGSFLLRAEGIDAICMLTWWCVRKGVDPLEQEKKSGLLGALLGKAASRDQQLGQKLLGALFYAFGVTVYGWGEDLFQRFLQNLDSTCPMAVPALKNAKQWYKSDKAGVRRGMLLFRSVRLANGRLNIINQLAGAAAEAAPQAFTWALLSAFGKSGQTVFYQNTTQTLYRTKSNADAGLLTAIKEKTGQIIALNDAMGISQAYLQAFLLYQQAYYPSFWNESVETLCNHHELLKEALKFAGPLDSLCLMRRLSELGEPFDAAKGEELLRQVFTNATAPQCIPKDREPVWQYLSGQTDPDLDTLSHLSKHYGSNNYAFMVTHPKNDLEVGALLLSTESAIPGRLFRYLLHHERNSYARVYVTYLLEKARLSPQAAFDYLAEIVGPQALFGFLASEDGRYNSAEPARRLVQAGLANHAAEAALCMLQKGMEVESKVTLLSELYEFQPEYDPEFLMKMLGDKSKKVRQLAIGLLMPKKELREQVELLLEAKKKDVREAAQELLLAYDGGISDNEEATDILAFCTKNMPKNAMASIRWALPGDLPRIRYADTEEDASPVIVQCYLCLVLGAKSMEVPQAAGQIGEVLNKDDLRQAARDVYDNWISEGAPAKYKMALLLYGLHGDDSDVAALTKQIDQWAQNSRGAVAAEAVRAMILSNRDMALMTVDSISRKYKNKQVKNAAREAFAQAAEKLGTTAEALGDRIIPTLGFDSRGELTIDFGSRSFTAVLSPELTVTLRDQNGKTLKSLPKPGANDDAVKAEKAKAEFTALKKSLKTVVATQGSRLEQALALGRYWDKEAWQKLYVENPIMHSFAIGLVWGVYEDGRLVKTFRYLEDGTFTDEAEEEFTLEETMGKIGLCHPLDLDEALLSVWQEQLSDYEVKQPINQLDRAVHLMEEEEKQALTFGRFGGRKLLGITLMGRLQKLGWYKGSVQDAGVFYNFYKEMGDIGVQLNFSGMYVSPDMEEEVTVGEGVFYKAGSVRRGSYIYDDVDKNKAIPLKEINPRLFSEMVLELTQATASGSEPEAGWRGEHNLLVFRK